MIRVKWALHAREEILYELMTHLKEREPQRILERVRQSTRDMLDEQEAVRTRIFTVQDVMQSNVRAVLQVFDLNHLLLTVIQYVVLKRTCSPITQMDGSNGQHAKV